jgi:hypothetical protein
MQDIHPLAIADMSKSVLEQDFANIWVEMYPDLNLITQAPIAWSGRTIARRGKLRADFAWDNGKPFIGCKPHLFIAPPTVLIECDGGVHRIKFDEDRHKEDIAYKLGFKLHRLTRDRVFLDSPWIHDIATSIQELQNTELSLSSAITRT